MITVALKRITDGPFYVIAATWCAVILSSDAALPVQAGFISLTIGLTAGFNALRAFQLEHLIDDETLTVVGVCTAVAAPIIWYTSPVGIIDKIVLTLLAAAGLLIFLFQPPRADEQ